MKESKGAVDQFAKLVKDGLENFLLAQKVAKEVIASGDNAALQRVLDKIGIQKKDLDAFLTAKTYAEFSALVVVKKPTP